MHLPSLSNREKMIKNYKFYALELYRIKLSVLPKSTVESQQSLKKLMLSISEIRPQLRKDLNELSQEYLQLNESTTDTAKNIESINNKLLGKMYLMAYKTKKKVLLYIEEKVTVKKLRLA